MELFVHANTVPFPLLCMHALCLAKMENVMALNIVYILYLRVSCLFHASIFFTTSICSSTAALLVPPVALRISTLFW